LNKPVKSTYQLETKVVKAYQTAFSLFFYLCSLIAFLGFCFSTQYLDVEVNGPSMKPTINQQWFSPDFTYKRDIVYINFKTPYSKGDIIVVEHNDFVIKRLIAVGGDSLNVIKNEQDEVEVYVNSSLVVEDYVVYKSGLEITYSNFENLRTTHSHLFEADELIIPQGYVFYMGDNRGQSQDCSVYGPVSEDSVVGKVNIIVPYGKNFTQTVLLFIWDSILKIF
jgi:signal peptidase I